MDHSHRFTDEQSRWAAVVQRDPVAEGSFFYAVKSTGIFCRPGCPSRQPRRENVEYFATSSAAADAGYRPCKRCRPDGLSARERLAAIMTRACRRLEEADSPPGLDLLAAEAGLSPAHFQRRFKALVGVSPKAYASAQQAKRLRAGLRDGVSVTDAIYQAGFGSSSRAYDSARNPLAMTPTAYRQGGAGLTLRYSVAPCFLGWVLVAATDRGICAIEFGDEPEALTGQLQKSFPKAHLEQGGRDFSDLIAEVVALLQSPGSAPELPLDIQGTAFQQRVWQALREIPAGTTASYTEIATRIGCPDAARAVAGACAANKLAVVIPCHRVVRGDGALSGYRWGVVRKQALLEQEGCGKSDLSHTRNRNGNRD